MSTETHRARLSAREQLEYEDRPVRGTAPGSPAAQSGATAFALPSLPRPSSWRAGCP